jgi:Domain of unknown function (DUF4926)
MIPELGTVALTVELPEYGLQAGDLGAVVLVHPDQSAYEVEFVALDGETVAVVTLTADQVRPVGRGEIAHARAVLSHPEH